VRNALSVCQHKNHRWTAVMSVFCVGSTKASELCRRFGLDPDGTRGALRGEGER
jgi:hypothetical protein